MAEQTPVARTASAATPATSAAKGPTPVAAQIAAKPPTTETKNEPGSTNTLPHGGGSSVGGVDIVANKPSAPTLSPSGASPVTPGASDSTGAPPFIIKANRHTLPYLKALCYGQPGAGKTFLWGTAAAVPQMRDVLIISAEFGDLTLDDPSDQYNFSNIDPIQVSNYKVLSYIYDWLKIHCSLRDLPPDGRGGPQNLTNEERLRILQDKVMPGTLADPRIRTRRYRTAIVDSLTEVEVYCMNQLLNVTDATKLDEEIQGAEWGEFKKQHGMVQRMIRQFRDLPMHILFTAQRAEKDDEHKRAKYGPQMTGKLQIQVQGFMDMVGYLVVGAATEDGQPLPRRMYVQPGPRYDAKNRFTGYRGHFFDNPTMHDILDKVGLLNRSA